MAGVNLREGTMEGSLRAVDRTVSAAAEILVGFNVFPRYRETVSDNSPVPAECREHSLNLGGNTDVRFALSISSGFSFSGEH